MSDVHRDAGGRDVAAEEAASARGWSSIQLAVLGFIGFCGVLTDGRPDLPRWLQTAAALLSLAALAIACVAVCLVATVAWPLPSSGRAAEAEPGGSSPGGRRRMRLGVGLTLAAVAVMALAASANWWPVGEEDAPGVDADAAASLVEAADRAGNRWCGRLVASDRGAILVATDGGNVELALGGLVALSPVEAC